MNYKEFAQEHPDYIKLVKEYLTSNLELMGEKFLQDKDIYYSMNNRKVVMEYPYLKMGER